MDLSVTSHILMKDNYNDKNVPEHGTVIGNPPSTNYNQT